MKLTEKSITQQAQLPRLVGTAAEWLLSVRTGGPKPSSHTAHTLSLVFYIYDYLTGSDVNKPKN